MASTVLEHQNNKVLMAACILSHIIVHAIAFLQLTKEREGGGGIKCKILCHCSGPQLISAARMEADWVPAVPSQLGGSPRTPGRGCSGIAIVVALPSKTGLVNEAGEPAELVRVGPRGIMRDNFLLSDFQLNLTFLRASLVTDY